jgi:hypothetical protein
MQAMVRAGRIVMTIHAHEEMESDRLTLLDIEHGILTGWILERQRDARSGEWKYLLAGRTTTADDVVVACRLGPTAKLIIITVYLD